MDDPIIDVNELSVNFNTYDGKQKVLSEVNLTVGKGETVALVGETGSGKSVTGRSIMGTLPRPPGDIVSGQIHYKGEEILNNNDRHKQIQQEKMSMIFQDPMTYLSPVYTVGSMMSDIYRYGSTTSLSWPSLLQELLGRKSGDTHEIRERNIEILRQMDISNPEGVIDKYPIELSGGMRQRVLIAMALLNEPEFLIADEPTTALDVTVQNQIIELLNQRVTSQNRSMLYITHNLGVARQIADRIYVMYGGNIVETGPTEELFNTPVHPYTIGLIESIPKLSGFEGEGIDGNVPDYTNPPSGCRFHPRCPAYMEGKCEATDPELIHINEEHEVACFLYDNSMDKQESVETAAQKIQYSDDVPETSNEDIVADSSQ